MRNRRRLLAALGTLLIAGALGAFLCAGGVSAPQADPTTTPTPTSTATVTPTAMPTATPEHAASSVVRAPTRAPARAGNLDALPVPSGTMVNSTGCASDGFCIWYNFYWAPTREVVMQGEEPWIRVVHERCHAHQHWSINGGDPTREDLSAWYGTEEAEDFRAIATGWPYLDAFTTANNLLEDFAEACALYYTDPATLLDISPSRYGWMAANLP